MTFDIVIRIYNNIMQALGFHSRDVEIKLEPFTESQFYSKTPEGVWVKRYTLDPNQTDRYYRIHVHQVEGEAVSELAVYTDHLEEVVEYVQNELDATAFDIEWLFCGLDDHQRFRSFAL